eukprot:m.156583 g.156583  ORF g.156583 m.156583 type:complete len:234 (+) comp31006_c0_seq1:541-1242(+)
MITIISGANSIRFLNATVSQKEHVRAVLFVSFVHEWCLACKCPPFNAVVPPRANIFTLVTAPYTFIARFVAAGYDPRPFGFRSLYNDKLPSPYVMLSPTKAMRGCLSDKGKPVRRRSMFWGLELWMATLTLFKFHNVNIVSKVAPPTKHVETSLYATWLAYMEVDNCITLLTKYSGTKKSSCVAPKVDTPNSAWLDDVHEHKDWVRFEMQPGNLEDSYMHGTPQSIDLQYFRT